ncbi:beta-glucosidase [Aerococcus sanguinicola]|uniref:beta-glucosidase family protein n=1 Tax=unclassified Aerococcus TaxID=2618060 RepID=UPI0008A2AC89|nr:MULTISPECIES: glycoside hydrolase family 3 C-terminal domain-containing protein [unclassified Aerococcus]MDK6233591.1 glycoside hydrolase family 3 C-terminal domain-containing protein [Aerococcus sp. UMB10185]MDK6855726.1 glycoside hydrolase family 3 C-terminal domain-containing protein [Aerococcus sp. UMB7533]MDK8501479.1 glycoside hydrolase family 3 C-terminal domain-containing protein [Aerococcus sp. UMB1112A]OFN01372.1 glycosyl hydrolase [Aerococcus sp. HMSC062A02]OHO46319.1 glycosyl hy
MTEQVWLDDSKSPKERAEALVAAMPLEDKIGQLHGGMKTINIYNIDMEAMQNLSEEEYEEQMTQLRVERHVKENEEFSIPRMRVTNGPVGVGMGDGYPSPKATALPMTIGVAASFDPQLAYEYGDIIGSETRTLGQHVLEGPAVCLHRLPISGRNFEYFSEDPYLSGRMGVEVTKAIQNHDVIAMGKHFVLNDQEDERFRHSVEASDQVMRELYLLPFEMLVKDGKISSIMSSYNRIRGVYGTEYRETLTEILRHEWDFEGYVQSDFWSTRSAAPSLNAGLDLEMPDAKWFNEDNIKAALEDQSLEEKTIDRALIRRFTQMFRFNQFDWEYNPGEIDAKGHGERARKIGQASAVLLKNDKKLLPVEPADYDHILLVGQEKFAGQACNGGGGSSKVEPIYTVKPEDGLKDVLSDLGAKTELETVIVADNLSNIEEALAKAKEADLVIIMAGIVASEGFDLAKPSLPNQQDIMVEQLLAVNSQSILVLKDSTPVLMPWIDDAHTVLETWNQGTEDGHVAADLIFGLANPSGKVPTTYAKREEDLLYYDHPERHPGVDEGDGYPVIRYSEGLEMGYRWYQANDIEPLFPFGYGLSYTDFEVTDVELKRTEDQAKDAAFEVTATVSNTGDRDGAEVVQVYLGIPQDQQPPKRLIAFQKVQLEAGHSKAISITIDPKASHHPLSVWDRGAHDFVIPNGDFTLYVGTSSEDNSASFNFTIED